MSWTKEDMTQQSGKTVVITGAHKGIGYETSLAFAENGATVILAVSDFHKGKSIQEKILSVLPDAKVDVMYLDLNELESIHEFAKEYKTNYRTLSILILNESIHSVQQRKTKEGFESHFGVNFLGHFALTGLLLDLLKITPNSRVITIGDKLSGKTKLSFGHFKGSKNYQPDKFYTQSKLANLLFAKHLDEKFKEYNIQTISVCCQTPTDSKKVDSARSKVKSSKSTSNDEVKDKEKHKFPLTVLYAATSSSLLGGEFIGPSKNKSNTPSELSTLKKMYDKNVAHNLWQVSENLCGVNYKF